jgi:hypothetical protein
LQMKMREEQARKAAKAAVEKPAKVKTPRAPKPKVLKPVKSQPMPTEATTFDPPMSLMDAIKSLTPEQAGNPKVVAMTISLQLFTQLMQSSNPMFSTLSDNALHDLAYITSQAFEEKPDLKQVFSRAVTVADSIEFRTLSEDGEGIRRLHEIERALVTQMKGITQ